MEQEGGTRVAAFIHHGAIAAPGGFDHDYLTFMDIAPTILDFAGTEAPSVAY